MASKAKLVTRTATSSSVTSDNIAKDAALTHAELDSNLINLRDQSIGVVADDSATIDIKAGDSLYIQGGTGITTSTNSDGTVTINSAGSGDITSVVAGDGLTGGATTGDATLNIGAGTGIDVAADAISVDVSDFLANGSNNRVVTATGTDALNGEANMTFDGSTLGVTGNITATTSIANDAISIDDNVIKTTRSNDDLFIETNGTGTLTLQAGGGDFGNFSNESRYTKGNRMYYEDLTHTLGVDRDYRNSMVMKFKATTGQTSGSSNDRFRNMANVDYDLNGSTITSASSYLSRGPMALSGEATLMNSSSSDSAAKNATGLQGGVYLYTPNSAGDITITGTNSGIASHSSWMDIDAGTGSTITVDNGYSYYSTGFQSYGGGTKTMNNFYHFFANTSSTNPGKEYAFVTENPLMCSAVGTLESYREKVATLTSSSTISVECDQAPVHKVTLAENTQFVIQELAAGQSVTIIITQDGTGSRTASFGTGDSTAVKFAGTYSALSTAAGAIDVVTIFNDGTNYLGNCAKAYA